MAHIVVAGSGLAGLSASVALAARGHAVTLVEKRTRLGGRTQALPARRQGDVVDNGQHVVLAGYHRTRAFLEAIGSAGQLRILPAQATLFRDPRHGPTPVWLRAPGAFGRLAPLVALLGLGNVPLLDRLRALRGLPALAAAARRRPAALDGETADAWLRRLGMPPSLRRAFWDPMIVSTLNEKPERVSAHMLAQLLGWGFLHAPEDARLGYPATDLDSLFVTPARRRLEAAGARIVVGRGLASLEVAGGRVERVLLDGGEALAADAYLLALDPRGLTRLLAGGALAGDPFFARVARIETAPILAVHVWLDRPLGTREPFEGLLDCPIEWVFDRTRMTTRDGRGHYYSLITSAAHGFMERTQGELLADAWTSLRRCYPAFDPAHVVEAQVVKHPHATFAARPGFAALRCAQRTPIANLFLAGDWTDTGLPSTMEGAVVSGERAVAALLPALRRQETRAIRVSGKQLTA